MFRHGIPAILARLGKEADGAHLGVEDPVAVVALHGSHLRDAPARRRRPLEAPLIAGRSEEETMRLRKIAYALAWLAALAMAVGAGWRPF
jgi:hypothetical protein